MELGCAQPQAWPYLPRQEERKKIRACLQENHLRISSMLPAPGGGPGGNIASANLAEREWTKQYWKDCLIWVRSSMTQDVALRVWLVHLRHKKT